MAVGREPQTCSRSAPPGRRMRRPARPHATDSFAGCVLVLDCRAAWLFLPGGSPRSLWPPRDSECPGRHISQSGGSRIGHIPSQPALTAYCHYSQDIPSGQDTPWGVLPKTTCRVLGQVSVAGKLLLCGTLLHQCHASDAVVSCDSRKRLRPAGHGFDHRVDLWTMPA